MVKSKFAKGMFSLFCLASILLAISCTQPTSGGSSGGNNNSSETIAAGWYAYTTNANSAMPQTTYLYIKVDGSVERAGSSSYEYKDSQLKMIQQQLSYSTCKKNADGTNITFASCDAPSWATGSGGTGGKNNPEEKICPYAPGEYLDCAEGSVLNKYGMYIKSFTWPCNKKLPLWSKYEKKYSSPMPGDNSYGMIDSNNVYIPGRWCRKGATFSLSMKDIYGTLFTVDVTFTEAVSTGGGNTYQPPVGCEWWCFEGADVDNGRSVSL